MNLGLPLDRPASRIFSSPPGTIRCLRSPKPIDRLIAAIDETAMKIPGLIIFGFFLLPPGVLTGSAPLFLVGSASLLLGTLRLLREMRKHAADLDW